ncbi:hypothetical protein DPMN_048941 [Dreissena polymorpha]|uniref:Uncharacterized protein n=1 Tax=Dreissena polymorpha TaxID=45954 RepID=A0A9D4DCJ4_DREPO|nr:hypothetical protein DPMN_048941 [Dreissena polymorpha]
MNKNRRTHGQVKTDKLTIQTDTWTSADGHIDKCRRTEGLLPCLMPLTLWVSSRPVFELKASPALGNIGQKGAGYLKICWWVQGKALLGGVQERSPEVLTEGKENLYQRGKGENLYRRGENL